MVNYWQTSFRVTIVLLSETCLFSSERLALCSQCASQRETKARETLFDFRGRDARATSRVNISFIMVVQSEWMVGTSSDWISKNDHFGTSPPTTSVETYFWPLSIGCKTRHVSFVGGFIMSRVSCVGTGPLPMIRAMALILVRNAETPCFQNSLRSKCDNNGNTSCNESQ